MKKIILLVFSLCYSASIYPSPFMRLLKNPITPLFHNALKGIKNCALSNNFHKVHDNLYRSSQMHPRQLKRYIKKHNIKTIINLRGPNPDKDWWQNEHKIADSLGIKVIDVPLNSTQKLSKQHILKILTAYHYGIKKKKGSILLHCKSGSDRTGAAAAILDYNKTYNPSRAIKNLSIKYGHIKNRKPNMGHSVRQWINSMKKAKLNKKVALKLYK